MGFASVQVTAVAGGIMFWSCSYIHQADVRPSHSNRRICCWMSWRNFLKYDKALTVKLLVIETQGAMFSAKNIYLTKIKFPFPKGAWKQNEYVSIQNIADVMSPLVFLKVRFLEVTAGESHCRQWLWSSSTAVCYFDALSKVENRTSISCGSSHPSFSRY